MPRSTYYFEINKPVSQKDEAIIREIKTIFNHHKQRYGVRRITAELRNRDFIVNHKKVQRLMSILGLKAKKPKENIILIEDVAVKLIISSIAILKRISLIKNGRQM